MKAIGPTFADELKDAGLTGLAFSWGPDGALSFAPSLTPQQITAIQAVYTAHDPTKLPDVNVRALKDLNDSKLMLALAMWTAGKLGVALPTARTEILTIYKGL